MPNVRRPELRAKLSLDLGEFCSKALIVILYVRNHSPIPRLRSMSSDRLSNSHFFSGSFSYSIGRSPRPCWPTQPHSSFLSVVSSLAFYLNGDHMGFPVKLEQPVLVRINSDKVAQSRRMMGLNQRRAEGDRKGRLLRGAGAAGEKWRAMEDRTNCGREGRRP